MKLTVDLEEETSSYDGQTVATIIREAIRYEVSLYAKKIAKEELNKYKKQIETEIKDALKQYKLPPLKELIK
jgi:hypothetical protein